MKAIFLTVLLAIAVEKYRYVGVAGNITVITDGTYVWCVKVGDAIPYTDIVINSASSVGAVTNSGFIKLISPDESMNGFGKGEAK